MMTDREWQIARHACTEKQLAALDLWRRGLGYQRIGRTLSIDPKSARDRVRAGRRRIAKAELALAETAIALTASGS